MKIKAGLLQAAFLVLIFAGLVFSHTTMGTTQSKSFEVSKGGTLEVSIRVGDISVSSWEKNEVSVQAMGIDQEDLESLSMTQTGNNVRVTFHPECGNCGRVRFVISVPDQFDTNLRTSGGDIQLQGAFKGHLDGSTSGGDISVGDVDGEVEMNTSGGDIEAGKVNGTVTLSTSGGDIHVRTSSGQVELTTSGGDITIGNVGKSLVARTSGGDVVIGDVGGEATVSTAGGDIQVGSVSGNATLKTAGGDIDLRGANGIVKAKTAGGDVSLQNITGSVEASTAGGNVEAELRPSGTGRSSLSSAGGDLILYLPENAKANVDALIEIQGRWKTLCEEYDIHSDFKAQTYEKDEVSKEIRGKYVLNGGGESISLETVNGSIEIRNGSKPHPNE